MPIVDGTTLIGWGAVREMPWHFVGLFASREEAQGRADEMGGSYIARYGERQDDLDTFTSAGPQLPSVIAGSMFEPLPPTGPHGSLAAVAAWIDDELARTRAI